MGKRGIAPKPTALRVLQGDRADRINTSEPIPAETEIPKPPLSDEAAALWDILADDLKRKGVLTLWDAQAFATYCDAAATHWLAADKLAEQGHVTKGERGPVSNPWHRVWKDTADVMQRYGARFGLTPSDRSQLSMKENTPDGTKERLLS